MIRPTENAVREKKSHERFIPVWDKKSNGYFRCVTDKVTITLEKTQSSWRATVKIGDSAPIVRFSTTSKEAALHAAWYSKYSNAARKYYGVPHVLDWGDFDYNTHLSEPEPEIEQKQKAPVGKQAKIRAKAVYAPQWCGTAQLFQPAQGNQRTALDAFFSGLNDIFDIRAEDIPDELARPYAATLHDVEPEYRLGTAKLRLWAARVFEEYKI